MKRLQNPFLLSGYQGSAHFCDRGEETESVISAIVNGRNLTLMSLRRMGKTGLIKHCFKQLNPKDFVPIYVDLLPTDNVQSMAREFAKAIIYQLSEGPLKTSLKKFSSIFSSIRPSFTFDPITGAPSVEIDIQQPRQGEKTLEEIFLLLESKPLRIVVALDEFQTVTTYPEKNIEAKLRSQIQHLNNVQFIFSGSQKHILSDMFGDAKRPFYQSTQFLSLEPIKGSAYGRFIRNHFKKESLEISDAEIQFILEWTFSHTFYVQYFCNRLYDLRMKSKGSLLTDAIEKIFAENEAVYTSYRTLLTPQQLKLLTAISKEGRVDQPTSREFLLNHQLTASAIQRTLPSLLHKEFLTREEEGYRVYDVFFGRWLAAKF